jgi:hypothetical protein
MASVFLAPDEFQKAVNIFDSDVAQKHVMYSALVATHLYNQPGSHMLHQTDKGTLFSS